MNSLDTALTLLAATSWRIGLLIVLCLSLRRGLRGRLPAAAVFAVWLVLALALLVPVGIPARWSPFGLVPRFGFTSVKPAPVPMVQGSEFSVGPSVDLSLPEVAAEPLASVAPPQPKEPGLVDRMRQIPASRWATLLWLAGVIVLVLRRATALVNFSRRLRRDLAPADRRTGEAVERCRELLGIQGEVTSGVTSLVETPALHGSLRPRLLMPIRMADRLSDAELELVILHELGHVKRRDLTAQTLLHAAAVLHWFNPLAWLAVWAARADCEHACDEFVLSRVEESRREAYGTVLLKVVGMAAFPNRLPAVLAIFDRKGQLKQRIERIAQFTSPGWGRAVLGGLLLTSIAVISLTRESVAQAAETPVANKAESQTDSQDRAAKLSQAEEILRQRIGPSGTVRPVGTNRIEVRLPGDPQSQPAPASIAARSAITDPQWSASSGSLQTNRARLDPVLAAAYNGTGLTESEIRLLEQSIAEATKRTLDLEQRLKAGEGVEAPYAIAQATEADLRKRMADVRVVMNAGYRVQIRVTSDGAVLWQGEAIDLDNFIVRLHKFAADTTPGQSGAGVVPQGRVEVAADDSTHYSQIFGYVANEVGKLKFPEVYIAISPGTLASLPITSASFPANASGLVVLQVSTDGTYYWNQESIAFAGLRERLTKGKADGTVTAIRIAGDRNATFSSTIRLIDLLREIGFGKVSIETKTSDTGRGGGVMVVPVSAPQSVVGGSGEAQVMAAMGGNASGVSDQALRLLEQNLADTQKRADDLEQRLMAGEAVADQYRVAQATLNDLRKRQEEVRVVMNPPAQNASPLPGVVPTSAVPGASGNVVPVVAGRGFQLAGNYSFRADKMTSIDQTTVLEGAAEVKIDGYSISAARMVRTADGGLRVDGEAVIHADNQTIKATGLSVDRVEQRISVQSAEFGAYRIAGEKITFDRKIRTFTSEGEITIRTASDTIRARELSGDLARKVLTLRTAAFRDYEISSDKITLNLESRMLTSEGETTVRKGGATFKAKGFSINLREAGVMAVSAQSGSAQTAMAAASLAPANSLVPIAPSASAPAAKRPESGADVVAVVGNKAIRTSDVMREIQQGLMDTLRNVSGNQAEYAAKVSQLQETVLQNLIDRELIIQEFRKDLPGENGLKEARRIPDTYIDQEVDAKLKDDFGGDVSKFLTYLQSLGLSRAEYRRNIEDDIIYRYMLSRLRDPLPHGEVALQIDALISRGAPAENLTPAQRRDAWIKELRAKGAVQRF